jgi:hypothetical protein
MLLRGFLPQDHISDDSKDTVKTGNVPPPCPPWFSVLLVSSAKSFYDTQSHELNQLSADVVAVDRLLAHYGPETKEARDMLRRSVVNQLERMWPQKGTRLEAPAASEALIDQIQGLSPKDDKQRSLQQALNLAISVGRIRFAG